MVESNVVLDEGRNQKDIELKHTTKFARIYRYKHDYAIKIIDIDMTIPPHNPMYELSILQKLKNGDNKHVVTLLESRQVDDDLEMLFPWYNSTLNQYMCDHWQPQTSQPRRRKFNPYYHIEPRPMEDGERSPLTYINTFNVVRYAQDFAIQLLDGLSFIHLNNIIHRDIKPENVLLQQQTGDEGITLVITDFGISYDCNDKRQLNSEPQNNKICDISTSFYKSPELLFSVKNYTQSVDIWSLGVIFTQWFAHDGNTNFPRPIFDNGEGEFVDGGSDIKLIMSIFDKFGIPSIKQWDEVSTFGSVDAFCGMFGDQGDGNYLFDKEEIEQIRLIEEFLPKLSELDECTRDKFVTCLLGMLRLQSSERLTCNELLSKLK